MGDEVLLGFILENTAGDTFAYERSGCNLEYALSMRGLDVADPEPVRRGGGAYSCLGGVVDVAPGESVQETIPANRWFVISRPGSYRLVGHYRPQIGLPVQSEEVVLRVLARSQEEMAAYVDALLAELADLDARPRDSRDLPMGQWLDNQRALRGLLRRLMYTRDPRAIPAFIEQMYQATYEGNVPAREAFVGYLADHAGEAKAALLRAGMERGLASKEMDIILQMLGATDDERIRIIARSLAPDSPSTWRAGAAAAGFFPGQFTSRLVAIARDPAALAREQALIWLAWDRTEEGLAALQEALLDPDPVVRRKTARAIRNVYRSRSGHLGGRTGGRPLLESDFPDLAATSALSAPHH